MKYYTAGASELIEHLRRITKQQCRGMRIVYSLVIACVQSKLITQRVDIYPRNTYKILTGN